MSSKKFAVFDIDGTLIRWQLYHAVVDRLAKQGELEGDAHEKIHAARMRWKNRESSSSFKEYESEVVKQFDAAIRSLKPRQFEAVASEIIEEYKSQVYVYTRDLMKKLKQKGYTLIAISGSQQELVQRIAEHYGFDICRGSEYIKEDGKFTGKKIMPAHNKDEVLKDIIKKHSLGIEESYAVGDSKSDASMLELVERPIAFNPDAELFTIASQNKWPVVIERKNMIYRLEYRDGNYILAETN